MFLVPQSQYEKQEYPPYLHAAVFELAHHCAPNLEYHQYVVPEPVDGSPHHVQYLLCRSILAYGQGHLMSARERIEEAMRLAIKLGMDRSNFSRQPSLASTNPMAARHLECESLRRTWWEVYILQIYLYAFVCRSQRERIDSPDTHIVPCPDHEFSDSITTLPQTLQSFKNRIFTGDIPAVSSYCYRITAAQILERTCLLLDSEIMMSDTPSSLRLTISGWQRHLLEASASASGSDTMMSQAYWLIVLADMHLSCNTSTLAEDFGRAVYRPDWGCMAKHAPFGSCYTEQAITASYRFALFADSRDSMCHSPMLVSALVLACRVLTRAALQLIAAPSAGVAHLTRLEQHREIVDLLLGMLLALGTQWPLAHESYKQAQMDANRIFFEVVQKRTLPNGSNPATPTVSTTYAPKPKPATAVMIAEAIGINQLH